MAKRTPPKPKPAPPRVSPLRSDPTLTLTARKNLAAETARRLRAMQETLLQALDFSVSWPHKTPREKLAALRGWADELTATHINRPHAEHWVSKYVRDTHNKAAARAFQNINYLAGKEPAYVAGYRQQFLNGMKRRYDAAIELQIDAARATLQNIADGVRNEIIDEAAFILRGDPGNKRLKKIIRVAFTRAALKTAPRDTSDIIVAAHADGMLDAFEDLGVEKVGVRAEWVTAGDNRVCPLCLDHEGQTFTIDAARGLIPLHPRCRCTWVAVRSARPVKRGSFKLFR
jgi:hypothetical protein